MNFDFELEEDILLEIQEALMDLVIKNPDEKNTHVHVFIL